MRILDAAQRSNAHDGVKKSIALSVGWNGPDAKKLLDQLVGISACSENLVAVLQILVIDLRLKPLVEFNAWFGTVYLGYLRAL